MNIDRNWLEEEKMYRSGKFYRPGGPNGVDFPHGLLKEAEKNGDLELYRDLVLTFIVPRNPRIKKHLEILAGFRVSDIVNGKEALKKDKLGLVAGYRHILAGQLDGSGQRPPLEYSSIEEIYTWNVLKYVFLPSDALELWQSGELEDLCRKDPEFERQMWRRSLEITERVIRPDEPAGTKKVASIEDEAEVFEERLMECYPDYYSVMVDMGYAAKDVPTEPSMLPANLSDAYNRATLRIELRLKAERFRSKKKEDIQYALEVIDKKYRDRTQPFFVPTKKDQLPSWLSSEMLSILAGHHGTPPQGTQKGRVQPAIQLDLVKPPTSEPLDDE